MTKEGWEKVEFTASDALVAFLDGWKQRKQLKTRAAAVRDLLEYAKTLLENPDQAPPTRKELRDLLREAMGLPPKK